MQPALTTRFDQQRTIVLAAFSLLLAGLFLCSLSVGAVSIPVADIFRIIFARLGLVTANDITDVQRLVLLDIRLPRLLFTVLIGAGLGISGASLQGLFRNPLVEPGIIGVSSGAALGAIVVMMGGRQLGLSISIAHGYGQWLLPAFAFAGGIIATLVTLRLSNHEGKTHVTILILMGVAITSLAAAAIGVSIFYADEQQLRTYSFWTLGDLSGASWSMIGALTPVILVPVFGLTSMSKSLNAFSLGEAAAFHSGVNVERTKLFVVLLCAMAVGTSVAFAGMIGFVGLVVPHIIRISISSDHHIVLPASALGGAALLLLADIFARSIVRPAEMPIGIITAAIGAPFFITLLMSAKKKRMIG